MAASVAMHKELLDQDGWKASAHMCAKNKYTQFKKMCASFALQSCDFGGARAFLNADFDKSFKDTANKCD